MEAHRSRQNACSCFCPEAGDHAERFRDQGFVEDLQNSNLSIDIRAADATMGYYMKGTLLDRLEADVITPAKARGYKEIWLVGPSMGGLGSLLYSRMHSAEVTGVLAIAPFLGDEDLIAEIATAGGLKQWQAPPRIDAMIRDTYQRELWRWLQAATQGREAAPRDLPGLRNIRSSEPRGLAAGRGTTPPASVLDDRWARVASLGGACSRVSAIAGVRDALSIDATGAGIKASTSPPPSRILLRASLRIFDRTVWLHVAHRAKAGLHPRLHPDRPSSPLTTRTIARASDPPARIPSGFPQLRPQMCDAFPRRAAGSAAMALKSARDIR